MRKKGFQKFISFLCLLIVTVSFILTGCSSTKEAQIVEVESISRENYIALLGQSFGLSQCIGETGGFDDVTKENPNYSYIQACLEWEVLESDDLFYPDKESTVEFAIETAIKSIGIEKIKNAEQNYTIDEAQLLDFYATNIAEIDISDPQQIITTQVAEKIIEYAVVFENGINQKQVVEYELKDQVKEVTEGFLIKGDGATAVVENGESYEVGDILYVPSSENSIAYVLKVTEIVDNIIQYEEVSYEDAFEYINITGTFDANIIDIIPATEEIDVSLAKPKDTVIKTNQFDRKFVVQKLSEIEEVDKEKEELIINKLEGSMEGSMAFENNGVTFKGKLAANMAGENNKEQDLTVKGGATLTVGVYNIKTSIDFKKNVFGIPDKIDVKLTYDDLVSLKMQGSYSSKIPLGKIVIALPPTPFNLRLSLFATIGADGEVSLTYESDVVCKVTCELGKPIKTNLTNDATLDLQAKVRLMAEATALLDLQIGGFNIINTEVTTGSVALVTYDSDLLGDNPTCLDIIGYVPLRFGVNKSPCVFRSLSKYLTYEKEIWGSNTSPFITHYHYEDGELVGECTRGKEKEVETKLVTEDGLPIDELKLFDFEVVEAGMIELYSNQLFMEPNESLKVKVVSLPETYTEADLVFAVKENDICSVSENGEVTALNEGMAVIMITTSDGKFKTYVNIRVNPDYSLKNGFDPIL